MWLIVAVCVAAIAVIAGILRINLFPKRFFDAPLSSAKIVVIRSPSEGLPFAVRVTLSRSNFKHNNPSVCTMSAGSPKIHIAARIA